MKPHEERVFIEFTELGIKIGKLTAFLASDKISSLPARDQELLSGQLDAMNSYHYYLSQRIKRFEP